MIPVAWLSRWFELVALDDGRTKLWFWQDYAVELSDDAYGVHNFNWGYYLESLRLLCTKGTGSRSTPTGSVFRFTRAYPMRENRTHARGHAPTVGTRGQP